MPYSPSHLEQQQHPSNEPSSSTPFSPPIHHADALSSSFDEPDDILPGADLRNSKARRTPKSGGRGRGQLLRLDWGISAEGGEGRRGGGGWKGDERDSEEEEEGLGEGKSSSALEQIS